MEAQETIEKIKSELEVAKSNYHHNLSDFKEKIENCVNDGNLPVDEKARSENLEKVLNEKGIKDLKCANCGKESKVKDRITVLGFSYNDFLKQDFSKSEKAVTALKEKFSDVARDFAWIDAFDINLESLFKNFLLSEDRTEYKKDYEKLKHDYDLEKAERKDALKRIKNEKISFESILEDIKKKDMFALVEPDWISEKEEGVFYPQCPIKYVKDNFSFFEKGGAYNWEKYVKIGNMKINTIWEMQTEKNFFKNLYYLFAPIKHNFSAYENAQLSKTYFDSYDKVDLWSCCASCEGKYRTRKEKEYQAKKENIRRTNSKKMREVLKNDKRKKVEIKKLKLHALKRTTVPIAIVVAASVAIKFFL